MEGTVNKKLHFALGIQGQNVAFNLASCCKKVFLFKAFAPRRPCADGIAETVNHLTQRCKGLVSETHLTKLSPNLFNFSMAVRDHFRKHELPLFGVLFIQILEVVNMSIPHQ